MRIALALVMFFTFANSILVADEDLSDKAIVAKVPRSFDMLDLKEMNNFRYLVDLGEKAYPALSKRLLETDDPVEANNIIGIFGESNGNKALPVDAIRKAFGKWKKSDSFGKLTVLSSILTLGHIGSSKDADFLGSLLKNSPDIDVQLLTIGSLAKIGDESSKRLIVDWIKVRQQQEWPTENAKKTVISEAEAAIKAIDLRVKNLGNSSQLP